MLYGAACSLVIALVSGKTMNIVWTLPYLGSLLYLAAFGLHPAGAHRRGSYGLYRRDGASDRAHRVGVVRRLPMAACHLAGRWPAMSSSCRSRPASVAEEQAVVCRGHAGISPPISPPVSSPCHVPTNLPGNGIRARSCHWPDRLQHRPAYLSIPLVLATSTRPPRTGFSIPRKSRSVHWTRISPNGCLTSSCTKVGVQGR